MGVAERKHVEQGLVEDNEELLDHARQERIRHEAILRQADRRIRAGLEAIRRATLRVVPK